MNTGPTLPPWLAELPNYAVLLIIVFISPLVALAYQKRIFPARSLIAWMLVPCGLSVGLFFRPDALPLVLAADVLLLALAAYDLTCLPHSQQFIVQRDCQHIASIKHGHRVTLTVSNTGPRDEVVLLRDGVPQQFDAEPDEFHLELPARSRTKVQYDLKSSRRGSFILDAVHVRVRSRLGLWQRLLIYPLVSPIHVYPDLKQLSEYSLLARTNRLNQIGVRRTRRVGQDNEFERLRDYTLDDNYRHIDWRSTARRNRLTVRDFQTNQSQRVVFLVDCGRMMTNEAHELSLLDHAFNAMLMLSYVALERGDGVGLVTFSDRIHSSVPVRSGRTQMNHLLHATYDQFPRLVESRYDEAFLHLSARYRKRSMVVLMTNLIDDVNARQVEKYLRSFSGHHLPLAVVLRDQQMFDAVAADHASAANLYRRAAAAEILTWRNQVLSDLSHQGVLVIDAFPEQLTAPLINRYLEVKARHML